MSQEAELPQFKASEMLAASITQAASQQTYYTIRYLVDRDRVGDAYRAYGYFRWVDDTLDQSAITRTDQLTFIKRQQRLVADCYAGIQPSNITPQEQIVVDLISRNPEPQGGLYAYIYHMLRVMDFDAHRRGRLISQAELTAYTQDLAIAVTEALHYFIGHDDFSPQGEARYWAVTAAHITHMLRDMSEDMQVGYFNIPREFLESHKNNLYDLSCEGYKAWVCEQVRLARAYFQAGKQYLTQVQNRRCRMAGYFYVARFEGVLDDLERADYQLQPQYDHTWRTSVKFLLTLRESFSGES